MYVHRLLYFECKYMWIGTPYHVLMICSTSYMVHVCSQKLIYVQAIIRFKSEKVTSTILHFKVIGDCINTP